ncbi:MAG: hypothetical protein KDC26_10740 [Armatimonadetes bacterium]|nr:hypothetical protein [Armatimonadota bacterium]
MRNVVVSLSVLALSSFAFTQAGSTEAVNKSANPEYSELHLRTLLGSIRCLDGEGRFEMTFSGTLLVSKMDGDLSITGAVKKEFDANDRVCYTGTGKLVADGKWRSIHWFGSDMKADWFGKGIVNISGEFARNPETGLLETGDYWYDKANEKQAFPNAALQPLPLPKYSSIERPDKAPEIRKR